jgi:hypothetical protein
MQKQSPAVSDGIKKRDPDRSKLSAENAEQDRFDGAATGGGGRY